MPTWHVWEQCPLWSLRVALLQVACLMSFGLSGMMMSDCAVPAHATALQGENECLHCTQVEFCSVISCGMLSALGVLSCRISILSCVTLTGFCESSCRLDVCC